MANIRLPLKIEPQDLTIHNQSCLRSPTTTKRCQARTQHCDRVYVVDETATAAAYTMVCDPRVFPRSLPQVPSEAAGGSQGDQLPNGLMSVHVASELALQMQQGAQHDQLAMWQRGGQ